MSEADEGAGSADSAEGSDDTIEQAAISQPESVGNSWDYEPEVPGLVRGDIPTGLGPTGDIPTVNPRGTLPPPPAAAPNLPPPPIQQFEVESSSTLSQRIGMAPLFGLLLAILAVGGAALLFVRNGDRDQVEAKNVTTTSAVATSSSSPGPASADRPDVESSMTAWGAEVNQDWTLDEAGFLAAVSLFNNSEQLIEGGYVLYVPEEIAAFGEPVFSVAPDENLSTDDRTVYGFLIELSPGESLEFDYRVSAETSLEWDAQLDLWAAEYDAESAGFELPGPAIDQITPESGTVVEDLSVAVEVVAQNATAVRIGDTDLVAGSDGVWRIDLALGGGDNDLEVTAVDAYGGVTFVDYTLRFEVNLVVPTTTTTTTTEAPAVAPAPTPAPAPKPTPAPAPKPTPAPAPKPTPAPAPKPTPAPTTPPDCAPGDQNCDR